MADTFPVSVLCLVRERDMRRRVQSALQQLPPRVVAFSSDEHFDLHTAAFATESEFEQAFAERRAERVVVVSDRLVERAPRGRTQPSALATRIREAFREGPEAVGLIALSARRGRTRDIDRMLTPDFESRRLLKWVLDTARGIHLKLPPPRRNVLTDDAAVCVHPVVSREELHACLALRHEVYSLMGYLEEEVARSTSGIELDYFDQLALHFAAVEKKTAELVGTLRLVTPRISRFVTGQLTGRPYALQDEQKRWCNEIANGLSDSVFRRKLRQAYAVSLPIFQSTDFHDRWNQILDPGGAYAEISRVVVEPRFRGCGVSTLLMRTAIAAALELGKRRLFLECIPGHVPMYARHGFQQLQGLHSRVQELDQLAAGMQLELTDTPYNAAVQMAKRNLMVTASPEGAMPQDPPIGELCLCHRKQCWKDGAYQYRFKLGCPLRSSSKPCASGDARVPMSC